MSHYTHSAVRGFEEPNLSQSTRNSLRILCPSALLHLKIFAGCDDFGGAWLSACRRALPGVRLRLRCSVALRDISALASRNAVTASGSPFTRAASTLLAINL